MSLPRSSSTADITKTLYDCPLQKHVKRFCDANNDFSGSTVGDGLAKIHSQSSHLKGTVIATFNATHSSSGVCPHFSGQFSSEHKHLYAKYLHLGTTRIWNPDGSINEDRWNLFVSFVTEGQSPDSQRIVTKSKLDAYLQNCYNLDPHEDNTGRNTHSLFSSKYIQGTAATQAWNEVYDRLTEGWVGDDPYISLNLIREFFEDSEKAFLKAENKQLPVKKPHTETNNTPSTSPSPQ